MMKEMTMEIISKKEAKKLGLKNYFTGKPCSKGHLAERKVSCGNCILCQRENNKTYREQHKEKIQAYNKEYLKKYYAENKEKLLANQREYWEKNKHRFSERQAEYREKNREQKRLSDREYRVVHKEKFNLSTANSKKKKPAKYIALILRRRAKQRQSIPIWYDESAVDLIIQQRDELTESTKIIHNIDHIVPVISDFVCGLHWHGNMQILTKSENSAKSNLIWPDMPDTSDPELKALVKTFKESCQD